MKGAYLLSGYQPCVEVGSCGWGGVGQEKVVCRGWEGHPATDWRLSEAAGLDLAGDTRPLVWPRRGESLTPGSSQSGSLGLAQTTASTCRRGESLLMETKSN